MLGIVGYGAYIPKRRIKIEEIAKMWKQDPLILSKSLMLKEKTVPSIDEDSVTIAVEASKNALKRAEINPKEIGAVYVGSESKPYAVKPSATIVAEALEITPDVHIADYEFACKGGSEALFVSYSIVKADLAKFAMGIGSDTSQGAPKDALEYTASAGGASFIVGKEKVIAEILETYSFSTDTPDFWRRDGQFYPMHTGPFTGEKAYFRHIYNSALGCMKKIGLTPNDINYAVFHQPNGSFPRRVAKMLGFKSEQIEPGIIVTYIGNTYSGCSLLGLTAILDIAKPGEIILLTSFGSGAGSDSFIFKVTDRINEVRNKALTLKEMLEDKIYITYQEYLYLRGKIRMRKEE